MDFIELVVKQDLRPNRPEDEEAPQMTDDLWQLAETCWVKNPTARPNVNTVCDAISRELRDTKPSSKPHNIDHSEPCTSPAQNLRTITIKKNEISS
jgi:hypothetical protein